MEQAPTLDRTAVAQEVADALKGFVGDSQIQAMQTQLLSLPRAATGNVQFLSLIAWHEVTAMMDGMDSRFQGEAWGAGLPGGGVTSGAYLTLDLGGLIRNTKSWVYSASPVGVSLSFFDEGNNCVGVFAGGPVIGSVGVARGKGSWK